MADEQTQDQQTQTPPAAGGEAQPPARPEGLPDQYWDATANAVKVPDLVKSWSEADAFRKAETERLSKRPESADKYELRLPETMKLPDGAKFEIDNTSPLAVEFRSIAHAAGLDQPTMEKLIGIYAEEQLGVGERHVKAEEERARGEVAKLGENGQARIDATGAWLEANFTADEASALKHAGISAAGVMALEKLIEKAGGPKLASAPADGGESLSREDLDALMKSPEYDRRDPATMAKVKAGFARLYPGDVRNRAA